MIGSRFAADLGQRVALRELGRVGAAPQTPLASRPESGGPSHAAAWNPAPADRSRSARTTSSSALPPPGSRPSVTAPMTPRLRCKTPAMCSSIDAARAAPSSSPSTCAASGKRSRSAACSSRWWGEEHQRLARGGEIRDPGERGAQLAARGKPAQVVQAGKLLGAERCRDPGLERAQIERERARGTAPTPKRRQRRDRGSIKVEPRPLAKQGSAVAEGIQKRSGRLGCRPRRAQVNRLLGSRVQTLIDFYDHGSATSTARPSS